ncbi:MAG: hypothetical protein IPJ69_04965 [Deltaproteobacteria bacterium]|nr:MAG: hypothetical protein IPJ69_04965 [Deltaproteobacteria bacterium]
MTVLLMMKILEFPSLYVSTGVFEESVSIPRGLSVLGGFIDSENCQYAPEGHETMVTNHESITLQVQVGAQDAVISDIMIQNQGLDGVNTVMSVLGDAEPGTLLLKNLTLLGFTGTPIGRSSQGLAVEDARVEVVNNVIHAGESYNTTAIQWNGTHGSFFHNTIHGGKARYRSVAFQIQRNLPISLINNVFLTEHLGDFTPPVFDSQCVIDYRGEGWPLGSVAKGNFLKPIRLPESTEAPRYFCDIRDHQLFSLAEFNALDESLTTIPDGTISSNRTSTQTFAELFLDSTTNDFHLILGSSLLDAGIDPVSEGLSAPSITNDHDGQSRPHAEGERYDIGAYELH